MAKYRHALPQLGERRFLTDGGIETTLVYHNGIALPYFAAIDLMRTAEGRATLRGYFCATSISPSPTGAASCSKARPGERAPAGPKSSASRSPGSAN